MNCSSSETKNFKEFNIPVNKELWQLNFAKNRFSGNVISPKVDNKIQIIGTPINCKIELCLKEQLALISKTLKKSNYDYTGVFDYQKEGVLFRNVVFEHSNKPDQLIYKIIVLHQNKNKLAITLFGDKDSFNNQLETIKQFEKQI